MGRGGDTKGVQQQQGRETANISRNSRSVRAQDELADAVEEGSVGAL
jgi:hypothetical protein